MARRATSSGCNTRRMQKYAPRIICLLRWPVMSLVRSGRPTKSCGPREGGMPKHVVGGDVAQGYLAVTAQLDNGASFYSGKQTRAKADHYGRLRKRLQHKGTRSATRRLVVISGRERRLKQATNHLISRRIVEQHPHSIIGLEDLTHIRQRTKRRPGKQTSKKQLRAERHARQCAFAAP